MYSFLSHTGHVESPGGIIPDTLVNLPIRNPMRPDWRALDTGSFTYDGATHTVRNDHIWLFHMKQRYCNFWLFAFRCFAVRVCATRKISVPRSFAARP